MCNMQSVFTVISLCLVGDNWGKLQYHSVHLHTCTHTAWPGMLHMIFFSYNVCTVSFQENKESLGVLCASVTVVNKVFFPIYY